MNRLYSPPSLTDPGHGGFWFRRGNAIVLKLGATASARELEGELDYESEGSVIPAYDYLRWVQGSMNLYFEQKGRSERSPKDGNDSAGYRKAVKLFKSLAGVKPANDKVDEKTQNALILANEHNPKYLRCLRSALDKVGYAHLTIAYAETEKPVAAIREFQKDHSGRFGLDLNADGFVGSKTHLALMRALKSLEPKPKPEVDWIQIVKDMPLATLRVEATEREQLGCLRNFLLRALRGAPVDDRYKTVIDVGVRNFVQEFKRRCDGKQGAKLAICFRGLHDVVLAPVNWTMGKIDMMYRVLGTSGGCICKSEECEAGRYFLAKAQQVSPESVYTCFRNVIEPGFQICRKPCSRCLRGRRP